jgi:hypothetical protein
MTYLKSSQIYVAKIRTKLSRIGTLKGKEKLPEAESETWRAVSGPSGGRLGGGWRRSRGARCQRPSGRVGALEEDRRRNRRGGALEEELGQQSRGRRGEGEHRATVAAVGSRPPVPSMCFPAANWVFFPLACSCVNVACINYENRKRPKALWAVLLLGSSKTSILLGGREPNSPPLRSACVYMY